MKSSKAKALILSGPAAFPASDPALDRTANPPRSVAPVERPVQLLPGAAVQPHRGWLILALGLLSIPIPLLSIVAWLMGNADLTAMEQGRMDRMGEANTRTGSTIGFVVTLIYVCLLAYALLNRAG
jgi:hypothetical protein